MGDVIDFEVSLEANTCCSCGCSFAYPKALDAELRRTGRTFYCPSGHGQKYIVPEPEIKAPPAKMSGRILKWFTGGKPA